MIDGEFFNSSWWGNVSNKTFSTHLQWPFIQIDMTTNLYSWDEICTNSHESKSLIYLLVRAYKLQVKYKLYSVQCTCTYNIYNITIYTYEVYIGSREALKKGKSKSVLVHPV